MRLRSFLPVLAGLVVAIGAMTFTSNTEQVRVFAANASATWQSLGDLFDIDAWAGGKRDRDKSKRGGKKHGEKKWGGKKHGGDWGGKGWGKKHGEKKWGHGKKWSGKKHHKKPPKKSNPPRRESDNDRPEKKVGCTNCTEAPQSYWVEVMIDGCPTKCLYLPETGQYYHCKRLTNVKGSWPAGIELPG